ncbi:MAG: protein TolR [Pseudomonadota bacterium]
MAQVTGKRGLIGEMNVVPYIDVMLVLLIIFMATTPLLSRGVQVDLPKADAKPLTLEDLEDKKPVILSVDAQGRMYLNLVDGGDREVDADTILSEVGAVLAQRKDNPVLVQGDHAVDYGRVVEAMVILQQAGAPNVGLMTDPPPDSDRRRR